MISYKYKTWLATPSREWYASVAMNTFSMYILRYKIDQMFVQIAQPFYKPTDTTPRWSLSICFPYDILVGFGFSVR